MVLDLLRPTYNTAYAELLNVAFRASLTNYLENVVVYVIITCKIMSFFSGWI